MIHSHEKIFAHGIENSTDLALVLNAQPWPGEDPDIVDPRDHDGVGVLQRSGEATFYAFDPGTTTETLAVLADGTAAAELIDGSWSPAVTDEYVTESGCAGVTMDWRSVRVWDLGGFNETTTYATPIEARTHYEAEIEAIRHAYDDEAAEHW